MTTQSLHEKYSEIAVVDYRRGWRTLPVNRAREALKELEIPTTSDKAIQEQLLLECWDQLSSSQEADILAMLNSPEALLLRIRGSHSIKGGCTKLAKRLLDAKASRDSVQGLYAIALWDEGKTLRLKSISPVVLPIFIIKLVFYVVTVDSAKKNVWWFRLLLIYIHRPWLEMWHGQLPYTAQFLFEDLCARYATAQKKTNFSANLTNRTYDDYELRLYCLRNGLMIDSPWHILTWDLTGRKLEAISQIFRLSTETLEQYRNLLASFHKYYKEDSDRVRYAKLDQPNDLQLRNMTQDLQPRYDYTTEQLLRELKEIARLYKEQYILKFAGVLPSASLDQPLGNESGKTWGDTVIISENLDLVDLDLDLRELLENSWDTIEAKIPDWILEALDSAFEAQVKRKGDLKRLIEIKSIFYLRLCEGLDQTNIGLRLSNQSTVSRTLKFYPDCFKNVRDRVTAKVIQAAQQQDKTWEKLIGDNRDAFYQRVKSYVHEYISPSGVDAKGLGTAKTDTTDTLYRRQLCKYLSQFKEQHNG